MSSSLSLTSSTDSLSLESTIPLSQSDIECDEFEGLPRWTRSSIGMLSMRHLCYHFEQEPSLSQEFKNQMILSSFSSRKFPSTPLISDTINRRKNFHGLNGLFSPLVDENGYAVSDSVHRPWQVQYFFDDVIQAIHPCVNFKQFGLQDQTMFIGYYEDGRCMIQQPGARGCALTCGAMLLIDHKVDFDLSTLFRANLSTEDRFSVELKEYGFQVKQLAPSEVKKSSEPVFANIVHRDHGGHKVILDHLDEETVTIREPFHGWRITLATQDFMKSIDRIEFYGLVQFDRQS